MNIGDEILNIEYHKVRLMIKSLNLSKTIKIAAMNCGISTKSLHIYINNYDIHKHKGVWISNQLIIRK